MEKCKNCGVELEPEDTHAVGFDVENKLASEWNGKYCGKCYEEVVKPAVQGKSS